jgi:uncharacterized protein YybS (DUF2232 family)
MERLSFIARPALALATSLLLFIAGIGIPAAGFVLLPLVPQPLLSLALRQGVTSAVLALVTACIVLTVIAGKEIAIIYGIFGVLAGLLFALLGRLRAIESLVAAVAGTVFIAAGMLLVYLFGSWSAMMSELRASLLQHMTSALSAYERMGLSQEGLELLREQIPRIAETLFQLLPAVFFLGLVLVVLINVLLLCRRFPERRAQWLNNPNLREWKGPEPLVWGLIGCGFALFVPGLEFLRTVALNGLLVIGACYFAQGIAIIAFFFHKNNVPRFLRGVTYVLIIFQQILTLLVVGLGLFDLWGDFRRLRKNNLRPSQAS